MDGALHARDSGLVYNAAALQHLLADALASDPHAVELMTPRQPCGSRSPLMRCKSAF